MNRSVLGKWTILAVLAVAVLGGVAKWYLSRPRLNDEQKLYLLITTAQQAVDKRDASGLTRLISDHYKDKEGYDKHTLTGMVVGWMRGSEPFTVVPEIVGLTIKATTAEMQLKVRYFVGEGASGAGNEFRMQLQLQKEGNDWKVLSAQGWSEEQGHLMNGE